MKSIIQFETFSYTCLSITVLISPSSNDLIIKARHIGQVKSLNFSLQSLHTPCLHLNNLILQLSSKHIGHVSSLNLSFILDFGRGEGVEGVGVEGEGVGGELR